ncbi:hypothetical protein J6590_087917 [Homalodisca vitripennis]|nr:hypothetical protein J6590_087917 [Homalodisca vitripennis]
MRGKRLIAGIIVRVASMSHLKAVSPSPLPTPTTTTSPTINPAFDSAAHFEVSMVTSPGVLSHESLAGATEPPNTRRVSYTTVRLLTYK